MMNTFNYRDLTAEELNALCRRPRIRYGDLIETVEPIIEDVRQRGDAAVIEYTRRFDGTEPSPLVVSPQEIEVSLKPGLKKAIDQAFQNIFRFHKEQLQPELVVETMPGVVCRRMARPIERVGLYIPGGTAPLPSTAMMLGIPAQLAGCKTIVMATPPDKEGNIPDSLVYIAQKAGVSAILKAGGAQAIAAMAWGTESLPKVDKIFGPGNQYVTVAKMLLQNSDAMVSIDLPAGPSEVLVIADGQADPEFVAADLLSQAEHGSDSQVVLVLPETADSSAIESELQKQLNALPRKEIASMALEKSFILRVPDSDAAIRFSNLYAPEHLILHTADAEHLTEKVTNAGSVFVGEWTPESLGDYASGTNHTLPTYGYAKMYSGVSLQSFKTFITVQQSSPEGLKRLGPTVEVLAEEEGLLAHKNAVTLRLNRISAEEQRIR